MGYIGMCGPQGYGFSAVLVINRVLILAILVTNRVSGHKKKVSNVWSGHK